MPDIKALARREPIRTAVGAGAAITAAVVAGIEVVNLFQPGSVSREQQGAIVELLTRTWVALALFGEVVRRYVWSPASVDRLSAERYQEGQDDAVGQMGRR